jgi:hypothetical protein
MGKKIRLTESQLDAVIRNNIISLTENNTITDTPLLRKLARKSIINFGKYNGWTVQKILEIHKKGYLRWVYYNLDGITFLDEILKEIGIIDHTIQKPGKDPEYGDKINQEKFDGIKSDDVKSRINKDVKMDDLRKRIAFDNQDRRTYSKSKLQNRNHGNY